MLCDVYQGVRFCDTFGAFGKKKNEIEIQNELRTYMM